MIATLHLFHGVGDGLKEAGATTRNPQRSLDASDVAYYLCSEGRRTTFFSESSSATPAIHQSGRQPFHE